MKKIKFNNSLLPAGVVYSYKHSSYNANEKHSVLASRILITLNDKKVSMFWPYVLARNTYLTGTSAIGITVSSYNYRFIEDTSELKEGLNYTEKIQKAYSRYTGRNIPLKEAEESGENLISMFSFLRELQQKQAKNTPKT